MIKFHSPKASIQVQNALESFSFRPGGLCWGRYDASPDPIVDWRGGYPHLIPFCIRCLDVPSRFFKYDHLAILTIARFLMRLSLSVHFTLFARYTEPLHTADRDVPIAPLQNAIYEFFSVFVSLKQNALFCTVRILRQIKLQSISRRTRSSATAEGPHARRTTLCPKKVSP